MESVSRLNVLKVSMFKRKAGKAPRLSARAAETRCLIPFAVQLVQEYMDDAVEFERTMKHCLLELAECYECCLSRISSASMVGDIAHCMLVYQTRRQIHCGA